MSDQNQTVDSDCHRFELENLSESTSTTSSNDMKQPIRSPKENPDSATEISESENINSTSSTIPINSSSENICPICLEEVGTLAPAISLRQCRHAFCQLCLESYVKVCLSVMKSQAECPDLNCRAPIHPDDYPAILPDKVDLESWEIAQIRAAVIHERGKVFNCPTPSCRNIVIVRPSRSKFCSIIPPAFKPTRSRPSTADDHHDTIPKDGELCDDVEAEDSRDNMGAHSATESVTPARFTSESNHSNTNPTAMHSNHEIQCQSCQHAFCSRCGLSSHYAQTIDVKGGGINLTKISRCPQRSSRRWLPGPSRGTILGPNTHQCPSCATPVTKEGGCNIVHCPVCRIYFCWFCGQKDDKNGNCLAHWTAFCKLRGDRVTKKLSRLSVDTPLLRVVICLAALVGGIMVLPIMVTWALCIIFPYHFFWDCYFSAPHDLGKKVVNGCAAIIFLIICTISMPVIWVALYFTCWGDIIAFLIALMSSKDRQSRQLRATIADVADTEMVNEARNGANAV